MRRHQIFLPVTCLLFAGCSTIDIQEVEPEKLRVEVDLVHGRQSTNLDVFLSRGMFSQPVTLGATVLEVQTVDGGLFAPTASRQPGRYGIRSKSTVPVQSISIESIGSVEIPRMDSVTLSPLNEFEGNTYFKDDVITLDLPETRADERFLVATGYCGDQRYYSEQRINNSDVLLEIPLDRIRRQVNNSAEADLNGVIPITLAIEERYYPVWQPPFKVGKLAARDETELYIDTSGFRFKAQISVEIAGSAFFQFQNQAWPVKYCY